MNKSFLSFLAALSLGAACVVAPAVSQAAVVQQSFTLTPDFGPLGPGPFSGSFTYDNAQAPVASPFGDQLYALSSFTLDIGGQVFTLGDLSEAFAVFDTSGFAGLAAVVDGRLTLSPALGPTGAFFAFSGPGGESTGGATFGPPQVLQGTVSEPGVAALALLALAAAAGTTARRRRG